MAQSATDGGSAWLSEAEWLEIDWPLDELRRQSEDLAYDSMRREHALHRYWMARLAVEARVLDRPALTSLLGRLEFRAVVDNVLVRLLQTDRIAPADVAGVAAHPDAASWTGRQFHAYMTACDPDVPWESALETALAAAADWVTVRVLGALPQACHATAVEIVSRSARPKRKRRELVRQLHAESGKAY